jgi:Putative Ig domain
MISLAKAPKLRLLLLCVLGLVSATPVFAQLTIVTASLPSATVGKSYAVGLIGNGGSAPYTWSVASGSLPPGLGLNAAGSIFGTPTFGGS